MEHTPAPHMPGLTGLRGIAVTFVIAYHLGYLRGGFLGVDVFFVLSGFLITTLLLRYTPASVAELRSWWGRRFTRLTPAVAVVVIAVLLLFAATSGVVLDSVATLTWWQNWRLILEGTPYWAPNPSPLRHAWSLSIEEQFYAIWPPLLVGSLALARKLAVRRPQLVVAGLAALLGTASFVWATYLAITRDVSLSRIYFGTDTRVGALLIGCAVAGVLYGRPVRPARRTLTAAAALAAVGLTALSLAVSPEIRWTYTGGLLAAALCAVILVLTAMRPGPLTTAMSWSPLQWLGVRSYALYLWSWPVQVLLEERTPSLGRPAVAAVTVAASLLLSELSLRFVEDPLRRGRSWARRLAPRRAAWMGGLALVAVAMVVAGNSTELTVSETVAKEFERLPDPTVTVAPTTTCPPPPPTVPAPIWSDQADTFERATVEQAADPTAPGGTVECGQTVTKVLFVGDSTGRGAANGLRRLAPADLEVWDRTDLGCGLVAVSETCPDWRTSWSEAITQIAPDVVVLYLRTSDDLVEGDEPPFLSQEATDLRRSEMSAATELLASNGARVIWMLPAVPLERGAFYCGGKGTGTPCDHDWVARWRGDVAEVAAGYGAATIDAQSWIDARPDTRETDRPDGLHFSGPALDQHASWLADQIRATAP
ncbi:MAG: DUF459 domain-containing protein [Microthrixaceae bacterium]